MTRMLAFDPGGTTGWSYWEYDALTPLTLLEYGQIAGGIYGFGRWIRSTGRHMVVDEIVSESFHRDDRTDKPEETAKWVEGAIMLWWGSDGIPVIWQRNTYKGHATDDFLKEHGLYMKGQRHARDSFRHAVASVKVRQHAPSFRRFWPRRPRTPDVALVA